MNYPEAPRLDLVENLHGTAVADPYRWLEDAQDARTITWLSAQDSLVAQACAEWSTSSHWESRLRDLMSAGAISPPIWRGERAFFMRRTAEQEHALLLTIDPDGTERVLIDPMDLDSQGLTTLDTWQPSKEGNLLAYQVSEGGNEESILRVMRVSDGTIVDGPIDRARYSPVAWLPGEEKFYYVRRVDPSTIPAEEEQYHRRIWLHTLGQHPDTDIEIFGAGQTITNYYGVGVNRDGRWLEISAA